MNVAETAARLKARKFVPTPDVLHGISPRKECDVLGRIHQVEIYVKEVDRRLVILICFAAGETAALLGREGFFDAFRIEFDKPARTTSFEYLLDEETES